jgi:hypothetical protein
VLPKMDPNIPLLNDSVWYFCLFNVCNPTFKSDLKNPVKLTTHD